MKAPAMMLYGTWGPSRTKRLPPGSRHEEEGSEQDCTRQVGKGNGLQRRACIVSTVRMQLMYDTPGSYSEKWQSKAIRRRPRAAPTVLTSWRTRGARWGSKKRDLPFMTKASCVVVLHFSGVGHVKAICIFSLCKILIMLLCNQSFVNR